MSNIVYSRELEDRLVELKGEFESWKIEKFEDYRWRHYEELIKVWAAEEDEGEEYLAIKNLKECVDEIRWGDGIAFIHKNYFEDHTRQYAEDCGYLNSNWLYSCIDWEKAARELQADYACITFREEIYYYQS